VTGYIIEVIKFNNLITFLSKFNMPQGKLSFSCVKSTFLPQKNEFSEKSSKNFAGSSYKSYNEDVKKYLQPSLTVLVL